MPSWNIHLEVGNRIAEKLKFSAKQRKEFLLGNLLPDINNGYINDVKITKSHDFTHYAYDQKSSLNFYAKHKKKIDQKTPIFLGYLLHLYTDGFFNHDFYSAIESSSTGKDLEFEEKNKIKRHDFWVYDLNFRHTLNIKNSDEAKALAELANQIGGVEVSTEDILGVERILKSGELRKKVANPKYNFYTEKQLDRLMDNMIKSFSKDYLRSDYA